MGPRLKDVEDGGQSKVRRVGVGASMGPRLKDVEDKPTFNDNAHKAGCFNGATSQGRGRQVPQKPVETIVAELQWGHVSRTWKTLRTLGSGRRPALASMGPRLKDVEDLRISQRDRIDREASMGPRLKDVEDYVERVKNGRTT